MSEKLRPCPFCGPQGKVNLIDDLSPHHYDVECEACGAYIAHLSTWNTRPIEDAQRDLMREAAKKLVHICVEDYMIGDDSKETLIDLIKRLEGEDNGTDH